MTSKAQTTLTSPAPAPRAVLTAVIDDGLAFAHDRFLGAATTPGTNATTRIEFFLNQRYWSPLPWPPGREISKRNLANGIDKLMNDSRHGALVDEDEVYRRSGLVDHSRRGHKALAFSASHGTHVMDLACNPPALFSPPPAGSRPIVAVQLPSATVADTSGASLGWHIHIALLYIIVQAEVIASQSGSGPLPVVVNVSYGRIAGPHDGSSLFEMTLDQLIKSCNMGGAVPFRVVLPAGNNRQSRCHACLSVPATSTRELRWRVLPDDWTESYVEIWLPAGVDTAKLAIAVTAPDGAPTGWVFGGNGAKLKINGKVVGLLLYGLPATPSSRTRVTLFVAPTASVDGLLPVAPAGLWRIAFQNTQGAVNDIHAWIQRDDTAPGYKRRGRQSYFDDPAYACYDDGGRAIESDSDVLTSTSYVKRDGTLNAMATGTEPIVIGGFRRSDRRPAPYSASGPVLLPPSRGLPSPHGPDAMLPSDDGPSQQGVLGAGTRSNSCFGMHGTSVAAPQAAQWIAERMAMHQSSDRTAIYNLAVANDTTPVPKPAPERGGGGRIDLQSNRRPRQEP